MKFVLSAQNDVGSLYRIWNVDENLRWLSKTNSSYLPLWGLLFLWCRCWYIFCSQIIQLGKSYNRDLPQMELTKLAGYLSISVLLYYFFPVSVSAFLLSNLKSFSHCTLHVFQNYSYICNVHCRSLNIESYGVLCNLWNLCNLVLILEQLIQVVIIESCNLI